MAMADVQVRACVCWGGALNVPVHTAHHPSFPPPPLLVLGALVACYVVVFRAATRCLWPPSGTRKQTPVPSCQPAPWWTPCTWPSFEKLCLTTRVAQGTQRCAGSGCTCACFSCATLPSWSHAMDRTLSFSRLHALQSCSRTPPAYFIAFWQWMPLIW
jgi:hypothetical protein